MMMPVEATFIPLYIIFKKLGLIDTHVPLILPFVLTNAFGVFLMRQFLAGIPTDLSDAAKIDGCGHPRIFFSIVMPLCNPVLAALAIFTFRLTWNDFLTPLIYLSTNIKFTVPLLIASFRGIYYNDWGLLMAGANMAMIPVIIIYFIFQRYFIQGVTMTGLKI